MRIWDIDAGFLNDKSLLGEHRELHGIVSIVLNHKRGYSRHPETLRWAGFLGGLAVRHALLVEEMALRGFRHRSPLPVQGHSASWPQNYLDAPERQFEILKRKYEHKNQGRLPLPGNIQDLWARHKYSVMARDYNRYKQFGPLVSSKDITLGELSCELVSCLRSVPSPASLKNALFHMWGYVSGYSSVDPQAASLYELISEIQVQSCRHDRAYLLQSTALGELAYWCREVVP